MDAQANALLVKQLAQSAGFDFCGISKAEMLTEEAPNLEAWLKRGYQGKMSYLENHFDKRLDPRLLVPGARSVVSLVYNYYPETVHQPDDGYKIAKYAYGEDYHDVIREKLNLMLEQIRQQIGHIEGRAFVDSAPVHERAWAAKSGLGWIGKNSLLLNRQMGSFFFLAELIIDLELTADGPIRDYCGTCTRCIDACPTDAIPTPMVVDGSRCISYLTIELKDAMPDEFAGKMENWVFGCDICQDVCPWNRFAKPHQERAFEPNGWESWSQKEWIEMTESTFKQVFGKSALKRTKFEGIKRNVTFISKEKPNN